MQLIPEARLVLTLLEKKKIREKEGLFVVEGEKIVKEGLSQIKFILYSENLDIVKEAQSQKIPAYKVSKQAMAKITSVETPQGVLGVAYRKKWQISDLLKNDDPLILLAVEVQDPGNLGTMIRSLDAVGGSGLIISRGTVDPYNAKVVRSTMGSIFRIPLFIAEDLNEAVLLLKKKRIKVFGSDLTAKNSYWNADFSKGSAIMVGNEASGLQKESLSLCDEVVKIPMLGQAESLNAAMASNLLLYEAVRQRQNNG